MPEEAEVKAGEKEEKWKRVKEELRKAKKSNPLGFSRGHRSAVAEVYRDFLDTLPAESKRLWLMTLPPRRTKKHPYVIPRVFIPNFIENTSTFFEDYHKIFSRETVPPPFYRNSGASAGIGARTAPMQRFRTTLLLPAFGAATHYASLFYKYHVVPELTRVAGIDLHLLRLLDRRRIFSHSAKVSDLIIGTGHGDESIFTGQFLDILWEAGNYDTNECAGAIIKLLSCSCGKTLGPDLVSNGAKAFQGYSEEFLLFADATASFRQYWQPWQDKTAEKFLLPVMEGTKAIIGGATNREAYDVEHNMRAKYIEREEDPELRDLLIHNQNCFVILGDQDATI